MLSHDLAKKLLELPNLPVIITEDNFPEFDVKVMEWVNPHHPDFKSPATYFASKEEYDAWWNNTPKCEVIGI